MNQGFGLNYNPNFFVVRDSGHVPPGMDCLQLQLQPHNIKTQPFHYLINEQAKSLLALQELQNEVGALLEFRDLVMETFPNLRHKMSTSNSHTFSNAPNYCSNMPLPLSGSLNSRQWEPGIKVKRKIVIKGENDNSFVRVRSNSHGNKIQSSQPKSSEAISGVQDSGFSTETNSSNKDHASSTTTSVPLPVQPDDPFLTQKESNPHKDSRRSEYDRSDEELSEDGLVMKVNEAEEELWKLLDVIHTKGTKLREEVETLQLRLVVEEIENHLKTKEIEIRNVGRKFYRRCRSLENVGDAAGSLGFDLSDIQVLQPSNFKFHELSFEEDVFSKNRRRSMELEDIDSVRQERNMLLNKLADMETENMANRIKTSELQTEINVLISTKEELQEQLFQAVKQKTELNNRIHELHMKFVTGDKKLKSGIGKADRILFRDCTDSEASSQCEKLSFGRSKISNDARDFLIAEKFGGEGSSLNFQNTTSKLNLTQNLRALDDILRYPIEMRNCFKLTDNSKKKLAAILKEKNYLVLQRHLLVSVVQNEILSTQLEISTKSKDDLTEQLDKCKKENDELLFQLEERNIELEGTRAQVRVLEKLQHPKTVNQGTRTDSSKVAENFTFLENDHLRSKGFSESEITRARQIFLESQNKKVDKFEVVRILNRTKNALLQKQNDIENSFDLEKTGSVIPTLALPWPTMTSHQSSSTESTHALDISSELEPDMATVDKCDSLRNEKSPHRRKPSKIPLNIQKTSKSLKSVSSEPPLSYMKKSDGEINKCKDISLKKCSLDNSNISITSRSPPHNPISIRYNSVGRSSSQLSMASQKCQTSVTTTTTKPEKKKNLTSIHKDENLLSSTKNLSLKQTTNFSGIRQRDTLTRRTPSDISESFGKRTLRSSLRDSFRSKISIDGNHGSSKKEGSVSVGRKDSLQQKQTRSNPIQQKTNVNKSILSTEGDGTKPEGEIPEAGILYAWNQDKSRHEYAPTSEDDSVECHSNNQPISMIQDLDSLYFTDSLNSLPKVLHLETVKSAFSSRATTTVLQINSTTNNRIWTCPTSGVDRTSEHCNKIAVHPNKFNEGSAESGLNFFDSIDNIMNINKDNFLHKYFNLKSMDNGTTAVLDSLEI